ncbi:MAG: pitrilysin family protein [Planctomycetota bacterium]
MQFHEARLSNGLQVIAELTKGVHSVGVGFFVMTGSRDETDAVSGVSHFLEHMAFKGNDRFSADDVNRIFDEVGAKYNAATAEELTMYYAAVLPEYLDRTTELLAALIRPALRQDDFDMEKNVILEEIGMYDDQPMFVAYEKMMQAHFERHPLGRSVLGTKDSVTILTSEQMRRYHHERYLAGNVILAVAGNCEWSEVLELANKYCASWPTGDAGRIIAPPQPYRGIYLIQRETSQQQHVMHQDPAPDALHPLRSAAELLSVVVGDDSGSRLYWELVDPGYVEGAELTYQEYHGAGVFRTFFNGQPDETEPNLARVQKVYDKINREGVTEQELQQAKSKVCSRVVLSSERPMGRLESLGNNWMYRNRYQSVADDLQQIRAVTTSQIRELLEAFPLAQTTTVTVGPKSAIAWK